jgi:hypothetical protein
MGQHLHLDARLVHLLDTSFPIFIQPVHGVGLPPERIYLAEGRCYFFIPIVFLNGDYPWFAGSYHDQLLIAGHRASALRW